MLGYRYQFVEVTILWFIVHSVEQKMKMMRRNVISCGAELYPEKINKREYREKEAEEECFGLPYGRAIVGIIIGIIIIIAGVSWLTNINIDMWPAIVIIFGVLIIAGVISKISRKKIVMR